METGELLARAEIGQLLAQYARSIDGGRSDEVAALFADSGVLVDSVAGREVHGRAAIETFLEEFKQRFAAQLAGRYRDHVSSQYVEFVSSERARAGSSYVVMGPDGPDHWGVYRDRLHRSEGKWSIERREVITEGYVEGSVVCRFWATSAASGSHVDVSEEGSLF